MNKKSWVVGVLVFLLLFLAGCKSSGIEPVETKIISVSTEVMVITEPPIIQEVDILEIPLPAPLNVPDAEISGMDWYGDKLVLLPQYPDRFKEEGLGSLFYIDREQIISYIENPDGKPVTISRIAFDQSGIVEKLKGFEGYEAISFNGDHFYITVETKPGVSMRGYVFKGEINNDFSRMTILPDTFQELRPQTNFTNASDEALLIYNDQVYTFYEDYGKNKNNNPVVHVFDLDLNETGKTSMPNIEYRFTDVTRVDREGYFWAMNYFYPGDTHLLPKVDPLAEKYGEGESHSQYEPVERLVKFKIGVDGVALVDQAPIQFLLLPDNETRNWEGLARLDDYGFLMTTDKYPTTILGFCKSLR